MYLTDLRNRTYSNASRASAGSNLKYQIEITPTATYHEHQLVPFLNIISKLDLRPRITSISWGRFQTSECSRTYSHASRPNITLKKDLQPHITSISWERSQIQTESDLQPCFTSISWDRSQISTSAGTASKHQMETGATTTHHEHKLGQLPSIGSQSKLQHASAASVGTAPIYQAEIGPTATHRKRQLGPLPNFRSKSDVQPRIKSITSISWNRFQISGRNQIYSHASRASAGTAPKYQIEIEAHHEHQLGPLPNYQIEIGAHHEHQLGPLRCMTGTPHVHQLGWCFTVIHDELEGDGEFLQGTTNLSSPENLKPVV